MSRQLSGRVLQRQAEPDAADDVAVTAGQTTSGIDAALAAAGHITGTVTGGGGALENVSVAPTESDGSGGWDEASETSTAADGTYDLGGLNTGSYRVRFQATGDYLGEYYNNKPNLDAADDVPVTAGQTTSGIDAALAAAGHITGTVTGGGGALEAPVTAYRPTAPAAGTSERDVDRADGTYDLGGLNTGSYRVMFRRAGDYVRQYYNDKPDPTRRRGPGHRRPDDVRHRRRARGRRPHHRHGDRRRRRPLEDISVNAYAPTATAAGNEAAARRPQRTAPTTSAACPALPRRVPR